MGSVCVPSRSHTPRSSTYINAGTTTNIMGRSLSRVHTCIHIQSEVECAKSQSHIEKGSLEKRMFTSCSEVHGVRVQLLNKNGRLGKGEDHIKDVHIWSRVRGLICARNSACLNTAIHGVHGFINRPEPGGNIKLRNVYC